MAPASDRPDAACRRGARPTGAVPPRLLPAVLLGAALLAAPAARADYSRIDKLALLDLLERGDYAALDERFSAYDEAVRRGEMGDDVLRYAYTAFHHSGAETTARLDDWIRSRPSSHAALLARAFHDGHIAILYRDSSNPVSLTEERSRSVHAHFDRAVADAQRALEIDPGAAPAYGLLISIGTYSGRDALRDWAFERGLAAVPGSLVIRESYLLGLLPRWGGSLEEIDAFLEAWIGLPGLDALRGYRDFAKARSLAYRGRRRKARQYFDQAVRLGDNVSYLFARGGNLFDGALDDHGLADFSRALERAPHWPSALSLRALVLAAEGEHENAYADWRLALRLDPLNPRLLRNRADALEKQGRYAEALEDMDKALFYGAFDPEVHLRRGQLKILASSDRAAARDELRRATELAPESGKYWYHYAEALTEGPLSQKRECRAVAAFTTYLELCRRTRGCNSDNRTFAEFFTKQRPKRYGWCF